MSGKRWYHVGVCLSHEEKEELKGIVEKHGYHSMSEYIRSKLFEDVGVGSVQAQINGLETRLRALELRQG